MNRAVLLQLALNTNLLPKDMSKSVLDGNDPALDEIVLALVTHSLDCNTVTSNDPEASKSEKRIARQCLVLAFLLALAQESHV